MSRDGSRLEDQVMGLLVHFHVLNLQTGKQFPGGGPRRSQSIEIPQERLTGRCLSQTNALASGIGEMLQLRPAISVENFFHRGIGKTELARPEYCPVRIREMNEIGAVAERRKHREMRE